MAIVSRHAHTSAAEPKHAAHRRGVNESTNHRDTCPRCRSRQFRPLRARRSGQQSGEKSGQSLSLNRIVDHAVQENRHKAEKFDFTFPVVLQKRWEVSKAYGIFMTPVGYLIDERGVIVRDVAMGRDAIVALSEEGLAVGTRKELGNGRAVR